MKYHAYHYENGDTKLDFSFPDDEKLKENKQKFLGLLKEAIKELEFEN